MIISTVNILTSFRLLFDPKHTSGRPFVFSRNNGLSQYAYLRERGTAGIEFLLKWNNNKITNKSTS